LPIAVGWKLICFQVGSLGASRRGCSSRGRALVLRNYANLNESGLPPIASPPPVAIAARSRKSAAPTLGLHLRLWVEWVQRGRLWLWRQRTPARAMTLTTRRAVVEAMIGESFRQIGIGILRKLNATGGGAQGILSCVQCVLNAPDRSLFGGNKIAFWRAAFDGT
jgi:hypothetical protein